MSTSRPRKSAYHHGDLRSELLRAAGKLLENQGPEGVVLREVARRAGVSHNAPYRHFQDRISLLAALAAEGFELLGNALQGSVGAGMGERYVTFALAHPQRFRLMFGGTLSLASDPGLRGASRQAYDVLQSSFRARSDVADPDKAAAAAWALVHGLAYLLLDGHFVEATRAGTQAERFVRDVMGSIRFAGTATPRSA
jgi:AcrR family transcriptional regulator